MSALNPNPTSSPDQPLLVDVKTVAKLLGRSPQSVSRQDKEGKLPRPIRLGSSVRWDFSELKEWVSAGCPSRQDWEARRSQPRNSKTS